MKKKKISYLDRGPTFVGLSPKVYKSKKEKEEKLYNKYKLRKNSYND